MGTRKPKFGIPDYSLYLKATNKCDITYVQCKKNARQQKLQEQQQQKEEEERSVDILQKSYTTIFRVQFLGFVRMRDQF